MWELGFHSYISYMYLLFNSILHFPPEVLKTTHHSTGRILELCKWKREVSGSTDSTHTWWWWWWYWPEPGRGGFLLSLLRSRVDSFDDLWDQLCGCCCFCERAVFQQAAAALCCSFHYCALFRQVEPVSETESPVKLQVKSQSKSKKNV